MTSSKVDGGLNSHSGNPFIQYDGANNSVLWLGFHQLGDVTEVRKGDATIFRTPDPLTRGKWRIFTTVTGDPGVPTLSISFYQRSVADLLELIDQSANNTMFLTQKAIDAGQPNEFSLWDRLNTYVNIQSTVDTLTALTARSPDDDTSSPAMVDMPFNYETLYKSFRLQSARQSTTETVAANDIVMLSKTEWFAAMDAVAAATSNVLHTTDGGTTWTATAADPFAADENITSIVSFEVGGITRLLVTRDTTAAALEVAYSDDKGATWTVVTVGATLTQGTIGAGALFALSSSYVWVCTDDGYIYFSTDGGVVWTAQESGIIASTAYNYISFADQLNGVVVGAADVIATTVDGGSTWQVVAVTGSGDDMRVAQIIGDLIWVGALQASGTAVLYYSEDDGVTWIERSGGLPITGEAKDILFTDSYNGLLLIDSTLYRTVDGGFSWFIVSDTYTANSGMNAVGLVDIKTGDIPIGLVIAVGEPHTGTAMIVKSAIAGL